MATLRVDVLSIFPWLVEASLGAGIPRIAAAKGLVSYHPIDLRDFTTDRHRSVDDRPYGGGPGMVMRPEPIVDAVTALGLAPPRPASAELILLSPRGRRFDQAMARELATRERIAFICGRYEGIDERVRLVLEPREISLGDFVLSGGELAAAAIIDAIVRLLPGVLGHELSSEHESFGQDSALLDHPQYTRPPEYHGLVVPPVLSSGDHGAIQRWRHEQAEALTHALRPDLVVGSTPKTT